MSSRRKELLILIVLLAVGLILRIQLMETRWINPDEGAHLMDGILFLDGHVPDLDFHARQLLYTQLTGLAVWMLGPDLAYLRLFPVVIITLGGLVVHAIARNLWDWKVGLVATALFLLFPFSVMMTVHTKTEPLSILAGGGAVYCLVRARSSFSRKIFLLFLAGLCLGAAFYIRESSLALLAFVLSVSLRDYWGDWMGVLRSWGAVLLGMGVVVSGVFVYYSHHGVTPGIFFETVSNPYSFVVTNLKRVLGAFDGSSGVSGASVGRADRLSFGTSFSNFTDAAKVSLVLLVGAAVSLSMIAWQSLTRRRALENRAHLIPLAWLGWMGAAYAFWTMNRGFFPAYFLEFFAPLSLLTAASAVQILRSLPGDRSWRVHLLAIVALLFGLGAAHVVLGTWQISRPLYFLVTVPMLAIFYLPATPGWPDEGHRARWALALAVSALLAAGIVLWGPRLQRIWSIPFYAAGAGAVVALSLWAGARSIEGRPKAKGAFVAYALLVSTFFLSMSESGLLLNSRYDGVWSSETLERVSGFLDERLPPDGSIASGGVIWAVETERRPFARISHPLGLLSGVSGQERQRVQNLLNEDPPDAIILDGFTERTLLEAFPEMARLLDTSYQRVVTFKESAWPVKVFLPTADSAVIRPTTIRFRPVTPSGVTSM